MTKKDLIKLFIKEALETTEAVRVPLAYSQTSSKNTQDQRNSAARQVKWARRNKNASPQLNRNYGAIAAHSGAKNVAARNSAGDINPSEGVDEMDEMKLGVAGRHSFDVSAGADDEPEPTMGPMLGGDYEEDLSCPECGGPPGMCDPMCPEGGMGEDPRDPDRYRH